MRKMQIDIQDEFWNDYSELVRQTVIPYQWEALNDRIEDAEPSYSIRNFRIAAGLMEGEFGGWIFQDSDLYKWLEAVAYSLKRHPDPGLEKTADDAIDLIGQAQHENGYLNTYYTIKEPGKQWTNLYEAHELYCAGHLFEAAVAYYEATSKRKLLDISCRFADLIDRKFGTEPGQIRAYCGHPEIELALVKLYRVTKEERYLNLSLYFIDERGRQPSYFIEEWERRGRISIWNHNQEVPNLEVYQSHLPVREQSAAVGHAVRAVYLYSAMADLARLTGDAKLREACERLWINTTGKQMYITGGIGSTHNGEAFTFDHDLPNDTVYAETCASIGLIFWARRMLQLEAKSEYADVMEKALYNNVLGSMSMDGKHFFYVNPLEVWPEASAKNPDKHHVKAERQMWFGCSCCPPNFARLLSSLNDYVYDVSDDGRTVYAHLFIGCEASLELAGCLVKLRQRSGLPWNGRVEFAVSLPDGMKSTEFELALRVPDWFQSGRPVMKVNGETQDYRVENGYAKLMRNWSEGDKLEWLLPLETKLIAAHPQMRANAGKAAIQRGPLVYCVEEADNGAPLASLSLAGEPELKERFAADLLGGCVVVEGEGVADDSSWPENRPYQPLRMETRSVRFKAIPYYLWGNRQPGEMSVWLRRR